MQLNYVLERIDKRPDVKRCPEEKLSSKCDIVNVDYTLEIFIIIHYKYL